MRDVDDAEDDLSITLTKQLHREEYETWQLVNELVFGENLFFEARRDGAKTEASCPKTLEIEALK